MFFIPYRTYKFLETSIKISKIISPKYKNDTINTSINCNIGTMCKSIPNGEMLVNIFQPIYLKFNTGIYIWIK